MAIDPAADDNQESAAPDVQAIGLQAAVGQHAPDAPTQTKTEQIAQAAIAFQQERTGHSPQAATVVVQEDELIVTLQTALSPAEQALAQSPKGAAQVQESHQQLLANTGEPLRAEIERITGLAAEETAAEDETSTGTVVQTFRLAERVPKDVWSGKSPDGCI